MFFFSKMPPTKVRGRQRKTTIGTFPADTMSDAVNLVSDGRSLRDAAAMKGLSFQTLARYVKKRAQNQASRITPNYKVRQVFTLEQENTLASYLLDSAKMFYGLSAHACRQLAFEMAERNEIIMPRSWKIDRCAGPEWFRAFMTRHPTLSVRKP